MNQLEAEFEGLSDAELKAKTAGFKAELAAGKTLEELLVPAFAVVREASKRALGMRHFDVQMIGGMVLNDGAISEMKTGEGRPWSQPCRLPSMPRRQRRSVVTVNDYLAKRDAPGWEDL